MRRFLAPIFLCSLVTALHADEPAFKLGEISLPGDCVALKPAPPLSPEDAARNGYRHIEALRGMFVYPKTKNTGYDADGFYGLHMLLKGRVPSGIMIAKAKVLLNRHAAALAEWDALLASDFYREPPLPLTHAGLMETGWVPSFRGMREATLANLWRIRVAIFEGRQTDAFADWLRLRSGLNRLYSGSDLLVSQMMFYVLQGICTQCAWELSPSVVEAKTLAATDEAVDAGHWRKVMLGETHFYVIYSPRTDEEIAQAISFHFPGEIDRPKTVEEYRKRVLPLFGTPVERARECLAEINRIGATGFDSPRLFRSAVSVESPYSKRLKALGKAGAGTDISVTELTGLGEWNFRVRRRSDRVIVALRAYAGEHAGAYPETLDSLVPKYLAAVPGDPYSGGPLLYDATLPAVWSVGPDFKDDRAEAIWSPARDGKEPGDLVAEPFSASAARLDRINQKYRDEAAKPVEVKP